MKRKTSLFFLLLCTVTALCAKVKLPSLVGDNMILQQQAVVKLWGWATPRSTVRVIPSWDGQTAICHADDTGRWTIRLATPAAGYTPYEITFDDGEALTVRNARRLCL